MRKKTYKEFLVLFLVLSMISPIYIIFVNTFKSRSQIFDNPFLIQRAKDGALFQFYTEAIEQMNFGTAFFNSMVISIASIALIVFFSSMAAWALVRNKTKVSSLIYTTFVSSMLIPFQVIMIPIIKWYKLLDDTFLFGLLDSRFGLIFSYIGFGASMSTFLFYGFIKSSIPAELEEAAMMDGLSHWGIYRKIVFPLLKPITVTVSILNLIWIWNDYLLPSILIHSSNKRTIPLSTFYFFGEYNVQWGLALSGLVLSILPVLIFYIFAQKYIVKGVADGAIK